MLVILSGFMGVGKTEIAKRFEDIGYIRLDRDAYRHFFFQPVDFQDFEQREAAYHAMLPIALYHLRKGRNVVFDGLLFNHKDQVDRAIAIAREAGSPVKILYLTAPDEIVIERLKAQTEHDSAPSRTPADFQRVKAKFEKLEYSHTTIDTNRPLDDVFKDCLAYVNSKDIK